MGGQLPGGEVVGHGGHGAHVLHRGREPRVGGVRGLGVGRGDAPGPRPLEGKEGRVGDLVLVMLGGGSGV